MKSIRMLLLLICLSSAFSAYAQEGANNPKTSLPDGAGGAVPNLLLTATVVEQKYCDTTHLRITMRLHFTNTGQRPVILYRYSLAIPRYMVSRNLKEATAKIYVEDVSPMLNPVMPKIDEAQIPGADSVFVVLQPNETYTPQLEAEVDLPFLYDGINMKEDGLRPGNYVLEFMVRAWYDSSELANKLSERWKDFGYLWTKTMKSQPIAFRVERQRPVVQCSN